MGILPNIVCSKAYRGRMAVFAGFEKYYREMGHESASRMIQARYQVMQRYDLDDEDIAHFDLNVCLGLLINTVPAACWTLYYIYSQPTLLEEVRAAISRHIRSSSSSPEGGTIRRCINIAEVAAGCPLVTSIVHETLRLQSVGQSARKVLKDTLLDGQYLLKQGSTVLIPSAEVHTISSVWGSSSTAFDAKRFCPNQDFESKKPASGYRSFGGGSFLCPGRFLAVNEIIIFLVIVVLKYDLEPVGSDSWVWPQSRSSLATAVLAPRNDIRVKVRERSCRGPQTGSWTFEWRSKGTHAEL